MVPEAVFSSQIHQHRETHTLWTILQPWKSSALVKPSQLCLLWILSRSVKRPSNTIPIMNIWNVFWIWQASSKQATWQHSDRSLVSKSTLACWVWGEQKKAFPLWIWNRKRVYAAFQRLGQEKVHKTRGEEMGGAGSRYLSSSPKAQKYILCGCQINLFIWLS